MQRDLCNRSTEDGTARFSNHHFSNVDIVGLSQFHGNLNSFNIFPDRWNIFTTSSCLFTNSVGFDCAIAISHTTMLFKLNLYFQPRILGNIATFAPILFRRTMPIYTSFEDYKYPLLSLLSCFHSADKESAVIVSYFVWR